MPAGPAGAAGTETGPAMDQLKRARGDSDASVSSEQILADCLADGTTD